MKWNKNFWWQILSSVQVEVGGATVESCSCMRKLLNLRKNSTGAEAKAQECSLFPLSSSTAPWPPPSGVLAPLKVLCQLHTHPVRGEGRLGVGRTGVQDSALRNIFEFQSQPQNEKLSMAAVPLALSFECYPYCIHIVYSFYTTRSLAGHSHPHPQPHTHACIFQACIAFRCFSRWNCFIKCCHRIKVVWGFCGRGHRRDCHLAVARFLHVHTEYGFCSTTMRLVAQHLFNYRRLLCYI